MDYDVKLLQLALNLPVTGEFDEFTEAALRNFQLKNNIPTNGMNLETAKLLSININKNMTDNKDITTRKSQFFQHVTIYTTYGNFTGFIYSYYFSNSINEESKFPDEIRVFDDALRLKCIVRYTHITYIELHYENE